MVDMRVYRPVDFLPIVGLATYSIRNRLWEDGREVVGRGEKIKLRLYGIYQCGVIGGSAGYLTHLMRLDW